MTTQESESDLPGKGDSQARAYEIAFCERIPETPAPGEIYVLAADPHAPASRRRSVHVLEHGLAALPQGAGPIHRIVVPLDPTLDDMLAATFCTRLLAGEQLPEGAKALAEYAESARGGLCLSDLPLDATIEGIFMAVRNVSGEDLRKPRAASEFVVDWWRLSERLMQAAEEGADPCKAQLFDGTSFADERRYLANDHPEFLRDVAAGEIWNVRLPGQAATSRALLLRHPMSLLFKYFARSDTYAPGGRAFELLAVQWGPSEWVFSTDPMRRSISLLGLHEKLQAAEVAKDPARAASNPWFDGADFQHTLVASPKGSSLLSDKEIERIVGGWCKVPRFSRKQLVTIAAVVLLLCAAGWGAIPVANTTQVEFVPTGPLPGLVHVGSGKDRALLITMQGYDIDQSMRDADAPTVNAKAIGEMLRSVYGFQTFEAFNVTGDGVEQALRKVKQNDHPNDKLLFYIAGYNNGRTDSERGRIEVVYEQQRTGYVELSKVVKIPDAISSWPIFASRTGGYVDSPKIKDALDNLKCRNVLFVLDVCDTSTGNTSVGSDGAGVAAQATRVKDDQVDTTTPPDQSAAVNPQWVPPTRRFIAAIGKASKFGTMSYTPLAAELLAKLRRGGGTAGFVTLDELNAAVKAPPVLAIAGWFGASNEQGSDFRFVDARPVQPTPKPSAATTEP